MQTDDQLNELYLAVKSTGGTLRRLSALSTFLAACQQELSLESSPNHYLVCNEAASLLGTRVADGPLWDWWQEQARLADTPHQQELLRIALFELVPDHPIIWSDLYRLWDFWFDPTARWAVFSAYWWCPRRLPSHLARCTAHRRRRKLPVPAFSDDEFQAWLRSAKAA